MGKTKEQIAADKLAAEQKTGADVTTEPNIADANKKHVLVVGSAANTSTIADEMRNRILALSAKDDADLMDGDAEYLKLELGSKHNLLFTGDTMQIPDKINGTDDGVTAVCGLRITEDGVLKPFINSDVMVVRKVSEWTSQGKCSRENPIAVRLIVAAEKAGEVGRQFKNISFRVD